jgi:eukaryotic-like serine/threonine-protein kinase
VTVKRLAIIVLKNTALFIGLLLTAALSAVTTMRAVLQQQEVDVPSLLQKKVAEAKTIALREGLELRVEEPRHHATIPAGRVLAQEPAAGSKLKSQRSVRVWVSKGPRRLTIPAVEGESLRTARLRLDQAKIPVGRIVEVDDPAPEGVILVQSPPAGEAEPDFESVSLLVSRGRWGVDYVMPDLIGRRADVVLNLLNRAGLKVVDVRYRAYPGMAPGVVLKQSPPAGHRISKQGQVGLEVSRADAPLAAPAEASPTPAETPQP